MIRVKNWILMMALSLLPAVLGGCSSKEEVNREALMSELRSTNKLVLSTMTVTKTVRHDSEKWYTVGKRVALYSYDSYLQAYIDLDKLKDDDLQIDPSSGEATLTLPPIEVEVVGRDMSMRKEYENVGLLRSEFDSRERAEMKEKANASFMKEVEQNPEFRATLEREARDKAKLYFTALLEQRGCEKVTVKSN